MKTNIGNYLLTSKNGYFANTQIPEVYWKENPKSRQILPCPKLTKREKEVLYLMCHNFDYQSISTKLKTGTTNIRNIVARLKRKTITQTSIALVATAIASKWVKINPENFNGNSPFLRNFPK